MKKEKCEFHCKNCKNTFLISKFIAKTLKKQNKKAYCPKCNSDDTQRVGEIQRIEKPKLRPNDPATEKQLKYIASLGGKPRKVKTIGEAGAYIAALQKLNS